MTLFAGETVTADSKAFAALMRHLKEVDERHTVIMVQVENETGLLGDSRDGSPTATKAFQQDVPQELAKFLKSDWERLHPNFQKIRSTFKQQQAKSSGSWEQTFGTGPRTDELFMAYYYAKYVDKVAAAGRAEYALPLYANIWQNYADEDADNDFPIVAGGGGIRIW